MSRTEDDDDDFRSDERPRRRRESDLPPWRRRDDNEDDSNDPDDRRIRDQYEDDDPRPRGRPPKNYLTESILVLIFCAWPLAIPALIYANKVDALWASGDYREARRASDLARRFCLWAALAPFILLGIVLAFVLFVAALAK